MQNNDFCSSLNSLLKKNNQELRYYEDESHYGFVVDDNENTINVIPILYHEERYLSSGDSESFISLALCSYGQCTEIIQIRSISLFEPSTYVSKFGNKLFALFDNNSWNIFFRIIKVMLAEIEERIFYQYSGWNKELDKYLFGTLLIDANCSLTVQTTLVKTPTLLSEKTDADVIRAINNIAKNLLKNELGGYILLIYLLLSHCKQRLVQSYQQGPEFVLSIFGKTNSFKTATSIAIFNTYNTSTSSFEDTLAAIHRMIQMNQSGVTIIDDYKISSPKNDEKYEKIVRLCGDTQTTGKYVAGNKIVDKSITGMSVVTGEKRPQLQQSSYARILFLDFEQCRVNLKSLTELQDNKTEINSFIVLFIKFILQDSNFDYNCLTLFKTYRNEMIKEDTYQGMYGRYYSMYGWLAAMWDIYVTFMQQYGIPVEFDFKTEIRVYIYAQHCLYDNNPLRMFKTGFDSLFNSNELVIIDHKTIDTLNFDVIDYGEKLFIRSGTLYSKICAYWKEKGTEFPCSEKKLREYLYDAEILVLSNGKRTTEKKIKNRSCSGFFLYKHVFANYNNGGTLNDD